MLAHERAHILGGDGGTRLLVGQRGHARGHHELDIERNAASILDHEREAVEPADVRDLVAVRDGRRGAARERHARIFCGPHIRGFDMQVAIYETRGKIAALTVDDLRCRGIGNSGVAIVEEHSRDRTICHRHTAAHHALPVDVYDLGIGEQRIGLRTALRHVDQELDLVCRHAIPSPSGAGPPSRAGIPAEPCAGIPTEPRSARLWSMIPKTSRAIR